MQIEGLARTPPRWKMRPTSFQKRTADFVATLEKIGQTRGRNWQEKPNGQRK
jgi:hypothetical protein